MSALPSQSERRRGGPLPVLTAPDGRTFGQILKAAREGRRMSMNSVAATSGLSKATISAIENDAVDPQVTTLLRLASALGITVGRLLESQSAGPCTCDPSLGQGCSDCPVEMLGPTECLNCGHRAIEHPGCCSCGDFRMPGDEES